MTIWGKILGGTAGLLLGGPLGALAGAAAGHAADVYWSERDEGPGDPEILKQQIAFTIGTIVLSAKMAKADGVVTRHEVTAFRQVFTIPPDEMKNVTWLFDRAKRDSAGFEPYARQVGRLLKDHPAVLEDLLDGLFHIAHADGAVHDAEIEYLRQVALIFGFGEDEFRRIRASNGAPDREDPYAVLGITASATDAEVKAAHLKLVRELHPDRLVAEGLPKEFVEIAEDKLAAINAAHDRIKRLRAPD
jgi:DnaJ like chaperone protein